MRNAAPESTGTAFVLKQTRTLVQVDLDGLEVADHLIIGDRGQVAIGRAEDVFADEANGTISHQEVSTTNVQAAETVSSIRDGGC